MKNIYSILIILVLASFDSKAQKFFMKIETPNILGHAAAEGHVNEIELLSFNYGIENSQSMPFENVAGKSRATLISVSIAASRASSKLFQAVTSGQLYEKVTIFAQYFTPSGNQDYATFEFGEVKFSSVSGNATEGEDENTVEIGFKAAKYLIKFKAIKPDETLDGELDFNWNFSTNSPF